VKVLVDSHSYLFAKMDDPRISRRARSILSSSQNELFFSIVSLWELSINIRLGRLRTLTSSVAFIHDLLMEDGFTTLPLRYEDILAFDHLPLVKDHRDPQSPPLKMTSSGVRSRAATKPPVENGHPVLWVTESSSYRAT